MCGADELPWFGRAYMSGNQLVIERAESDSGSVYVPWRIDGHGVLLVATSTLMERERPYQLEVELARGTINRLRNQVAQWEMLGLIISDGMRKQVLAMTHDFSQAATTEDAGDGGGVGRAGADGRDGCDGSIGGGLCGAGDRDAAGAIAEADDVVWRAFGRRRCRRWRWRGNC